MQETISEADILDFLDKLKLFVPNQGEYEYHSSENFQYLIKTGNHSIKVSMEQLIANRKKQLTQEHFKAIADGLVKKEESSANVRPAPQPARKPDRQETFEKKVDAGYKIYRNLLYLLIIFGLIAGAIYFIYENNRSRVHFGDGGTYGSNSQTLASNEEEPAYQRPKTEAELKAELYNRESVRATELLTGSMRYTPIYKNLLSMKVVGMKLKGELVNNATLATFKNVRIKVKFLSDTGSELFTRTFEVYDFVGPNSSTGFTQEIEVTHQEYLDINTFEWDVVSAES